MASCTRHASQSVIATRWGKKGSILRPVLPWQHAMMLSPGSGRPAWPLARAISVTIQCNSRNVRQAAGVLQTMAPLGGYYPRRGMLHSVREKGEGPNMRQIHVLVDREIACLADPAEVGEVCQISILHGARRWALRCQQQACLVQLSHQLGLHLRVLLDEIPVTRWQACNRAFEPRAALPSCTVSSTHFQAFPSALGQMLFTSGSTPPPDRNDYGCLVITVL